jgi:hypothetical protein
MPGRLSGSGMRFNFPQAIHQAIFVMPQSERRLVLNQGNAQLFEGA